MSTYNPGAKELIKVEELLADRPDDDPVKVGVAKAIALMKARDTYCENVSSNPSAALRTLKESTMTYPFQEAFDSGKSKWNLNPRMMSGPLEGTLLQTLVSMSKAKRVLEIGMFTGYAALACAEVLPSDGEVVTCEYDPFLEGVARKFFDASPHGKKIHIRIAPAADTLVKLGEEKQQFGFVFIDANKDGYKEYYQLVMKHNLLAKDGVVAFDNALMSGSPYHPDGPQTDNGASIKKCNEFLQTLDNVHRIMVPIRDGLFIVRRREDTFIDGPL